MNNLKKQNAALSFDIIQRWMQSVITNPHGVESGLNSEEARKELGEQDDQSNFIALPSNTLTANERLQIYSDAYFARLIECLALEYPSIAYIVGEETFTEFCIGYLQAYPSQSYTLGDLSNRFADFLDETRPEETQNTEEPNWADFLVDLAKLERCYGDVFDSPGEEKKEIDLAKQLEQISPEEWPHCRLIPSQTLHIMHVRFPVHEYITAVRNEEEPAPPEPKSTWLAISRREYIVRRCVITEQQARILKAILRNATIDEALSQFSETEAEGILPHLKSWFDEWTAAQLFCGVEKLRGR